MTLGTVLFQSALGGPHASLLRSCYFSSSSSFFVLSCADTAVVQTGSIEVQWDVDKIDVFEAAQTFSVVTSDLVDPPDLDEDQMAFNDTVNRADHRGDAGRAGLPWSSCQPMRPKRTQPDLWAANGLARTTEGGYYYRVRRWLGGGATGAGTGTPARIGVRPTSSGTWAACSFPCFRHPTEGEEPEPIFNGLAQSVVGTGTDVANDGPRRRAGDLRAVAGSADLQPSVAGAMPAAFASVLLG